MSDRGSFVTEYMYCDECQKKMFELLNRPEECDAYIIPNESTDKQVIAGIVKSVNSHLSGEFFMYLDKLGKDKYPCHNVRIIVINESQSIDKITIGPDGIEWDANLE